MAISRTKKEMKENLEKVVSRESSREIKDMVSRGYILQDLKEKVPIKSISLKQEGIPWENLQVWRNTERGRRISSPLGKATANFYLFQIEETSRKIWKVSFLESLETLRARRVPIKEARGQAWFQAQTEAIRFIEGQEELLCQLRKGLLQQYRKLAEYSSSEREILQEKLDDRQRVLAFLREQLGEFKEKVRPSEKEEVETFNRWFTGENRDLKTEVEGVYLENKEELSELLNNHTLLLSGGSIDEMSDWDETHEMVDGDFSNERKALHQILWTDSGEFRDSEMLQTGEDLLQKISQAQSIETLRSLIRWAQFLSFARVSRQKGRVWQIPGRTAERSQVLMISLLNRIKKGEKFCRQNPEREDYRVALEKLRKTWSDTRENCTLPQGITFRVYAQAMNRACEKALKILREQGEDTHWEINPCFRGMISSEGDFDLTPSSEEEAERINNQLITPVLWLPFRVYYVRPHWGHSEDISLHLDGEEPPSSDDAMTRRGGDLSSQENRDQFPPYQGGLSWEPDPEEQIENSQRAFIRWEILNHERKETLPAPKIQGGTIPLFPPAKKVYRTNWSGNCWVDGTWTILRPVRVVSKVSIPRRVQLS